MTDARVASGDVPRTEDDPEVDRLIVLESTGDDASQLSLALTRAGFRHVQVDLDAGLLRTANVMSLVAVPRRRVDEVRSLAKSAAGARSGQVPMTLTAVSPTTYGPSITVQAGVGGVSANVVRLLSLTPLDDWR